MSINQHSFYLRSGSGHIACTALIPEEVSGAVLLLPPFAEERKGTLPLLLKTARELCNTETASLIFDWRGTGDSTGNFEDVNPIDFATDAATAIAWLREQCGGVPITALGVRLSATMLLHLPDIHSVVDNFVLIAPATGTEFIRQLLQRRMVNDMVAYGKAIESRASLLEKLKSGSSVDLDGYIFSASMYKWAEGISTSDIQCCASQKPTSLIAGGHTPKCAGEISEAFSNITKSELRFPPFWNTVGHVNLSEIVESISNWITSKAGECNLSKSFNEATTAPGLELLPIESDEEEPQIIRTVLNTPKGNPKAAALFLPGWSGDRTGPHRIFVQLARELTNTGVICMRPDFRGRGLSDGEHSAGTIASMTADAATALEALKQRVPPDTPIYIAAICSGCKVAISLAAEYPKLDKLLLLSAESMGSLRSDKTDSNKTKKALKTYLKKLTQPETWKKIITGKVQTKMVTKALVKHETRSNDEAAAEDATLKGFQQFNNPIHFVFGGSDPDAPGSMRAYKAFCKKHTIPHSMYLIPNAGHSYYSTAWTKEVIETSVDFLG